MIFSSELFAVSSQVVTEGRARFLGVSNFDLLGPKVDTAVDRLYNVITSNVDQQKSTIM